MKKPANFGDTYTVAASTSPQSLCWDALMHMQGIYLHIILCEYMVTSFCRRFVHISSQFALPEDSMPIVLLILKKIANGE